VTGIFHIVVARKPIEGTIVENCLQWGCGALNIDGCRIEHVTIAGGNLALNPHLRTHINGGNIIVHEDDRRVVIPHVVGRWPANLVLGGEEVVELFPMTQPAGNTRATDGITAGNSIFGIGSNGMRNPKIPGDCGGSASRFFFNFSEQESDE
jgi:site-specific DNA-methyltransferase (adenine-specific)